MVWFMRYRSTRSAVFSTKYHVIWCPKYRRKVAVAQLVKVLKGRSSRRLHQELPHLARMKCLWAPSYFVSTVGGAPLEVVRRYVENQKVTAARYTAKPGKAA